MAKGYSLHIGLNHVDPSHYAGWNGKLNCCVNDANAMLEIAAKFEECEVICDEEATRSKVISSLKKNAQRAESGDLFFLTYSGHGGSVPDKNYDEKFDLVDETWCLYDGQLIDDELHNIFGLFKEGVRVFVISDSCHSGTITRSGEANDSNQILEEMMRSQGYKEKAPSKAMARVVYKNNKIFYDKLQGIPVVDLSNIGASILLLSGCQDNQKSYEGFEDHGVLTERIIELWEGGTFKDSYKNFHKMICATMPQIQTPNLYLTGKANDDFMHQVPFSI